MASEATLPEATTEDSNKLSSFGTGSKLFINYIAIIIILISGGALFFLLCMATKNHTTTADDNRAFENIKTLFSILLPVIGTWMGTILAFYFSKENFEAASQRIKEMASQISAADEKLQVMNVSDVMIRPSDSSLYVVPDEAAFKAMSILELLKIMNSSHSERMPIIQEKTLKFIFLIYKSTLERFLLGFKLGQITLKEVQTPGDPEQQPKNDSSLTIDDMFQSNYELIKDIIDLNSKQLFLPLSATMEDAKKAMQDNTICQDVFITKTGSKEEAVEGWITNNLIIEKAELFKRSGPKA